MVDPKPGQLWLRKNAPAGTTWKIITVGEGDGDFITKVRWTPTPGPQHTIRKRVFLNKYEIVEEVK